MALGRPNSRYALGLGLLLSLASIFTARGQQTISARAGLITAALGEAKIDGRSVPSGSRNPTRSNRSLRELRSGQTLTTMNGRVELLLGPDVYLRLDHRSVLRLENESLIEASAELAKGVALVEVVAMPKGSVVQIHIADTVTILKYPGLYRFDTGPDSADPVVEVYGGEATVGQWSPSAFLQLSETPGIRVTKGKALFLSPPSEEAASVTGFGSPMSFDRHLKRDDSLHVWSVERSFDLFNTIAVGKQHNWNATLRGTLFNDNYDTELWSRNAGRVAMPPSTIDTRIRDHIDNSQSGNDRPQGSNDSSQGNKERAQGTNERPQGNREKATNPTPAQ
ncbi:MAG: hypothetical protein ABI824_11470 [Acidobacteriota bacterium]